MNLMCRFHHLFVFIYLLHLFTQGKPKQLTLVLIYQIVLYIYYVLGFYLNFYNIYIYRGLVICLHFIYLHVIAIRYA